MPMIQRYKLVGKMLNIYIEKDLEKQMSEISKWLQANRLSLHLGKTESILFSSVCKLKKASKMKISYNNIDIEAKSSVK